MASIISSDLRIILETKTQYVSDRNNIPNNQQALELSPVTKHVADGLGIDLKVAEHTFTSCIMKDGSIKVYGPSVACRNGVPSLVWGKLTIPVSSLPLALAKNDQNRYIFEYTDSEGDSYDFNIQLIKDLDVNFDVKKAYIKGTLADYLTKGFEKATKLNEVVPGDYEVVEVRENDFKGELSYDVRVLGIGWVKTNAKMKRRLISDNLVISEQEPALLTVHGVVGKTNSGYDIVSVEFLTQRETKLPEFSF